MNLKKELPPVDPELPFAHLKPVVEELLGSGNALAQPIGGHLPNRAGFYEDKDGWVCDLVHPIDFARLRQIFDLPSFLRLNEAGQTISCDRTWCQIRGSV